MCVFMHIYVLYVFANMHHRWDIYDYVQDLDQSTVLHTCLPNLKMVRATVKQLLKMESTSKNRPNQKKRWSL